MMNGLDLVGIFRVGFVKMGRVTVEVELIEPSPSVRYRDVNELFDHTVGKKIRLRLDSAESSEGR
jgi:hypothetical protein